MSSPAGSPAPESAAAAPAAEANGAAGDALKDQKSPAPASATSAVEEEGKSGSDKDSDGGSDLFGADDDAEKKAQSEDDDEDQIRPVRKRRIGVGSEDEDEDAAPSPATKRPSPGPASQASQVQRTRGGSLAPSTPEASPQRSRAGSSVPDAEREALEYREEDDPYMQAEVQENMATLSLPQMPVRRTREHWVAKLPNFLEFNEEPFDEETWDPAESEKAGQVRIVDPQLRSLMKTNNTVRWRWRDERRSDGSRVPESNARIVQWNDGSMSLQVGSELFDIQSHLEANANASAADARARNIAAAIQQSSIASDSSASSLLQKPAKANGQGSGRKRMPSQTAEPDRQSTALSYLVVPHDDAEILTVELPITGTLSFKPSDVNSQTHRQLAAAVKHHRVAKITASEGPEKDPDLLQEEEDKRLKDIQRKKQRERKKKEEEAELDAFSSRRRRYDGDDTIMEASFSRSRAGGGRRSGVSRGRSEDYEEDDFVVTRRGKGSGSDDDDEDAEGEDDDMDIDDEPDEMEKMEAQIEANEKARKEGAKPSSQGRANAADADDEEPAASAPVKRKLVVMDDDDE